MTTLKGHTGECLVCNETFVAISNGQKYCSLEHRRVAYNQRNRHRVKRKCLNCSAYYLGRKGAKFCSDCRSGLNFKWLPVEIVYLASINQGYGFRRFVTALYGLGSGEGNSTQHHRVLQALMDFKEQTNNDFYDLLQSPEVGMETIQYREQRERRGVHSIPRYQGQRGRQGTRHENRTAKIKVPKEMEFNWGKFADDPRVTGEHTRIIQKYRDA